jgi:hypothetical protein
VIARVALGAGVLLLLAGCTAAPSPVLIGDSSQCIPSDRYDDVLVGVPLENPGNADVTITDLTFPTLEGVDVVEAWLVDADPQDDGTTLGYGVEEFPIDASTRPSWDDRVPAVGATLAADHDAFIALHLRRVDPDALLDGVSVSYRLGEALHTVESNWQVEFASTGC